MGAVFVSYSRQQLYFAELMTLELQKNNFDVWFDLQRLHPGCDWAVELHRAVAECDKLILIASRTSLASPYVEQEWMTALADGKPVIVVLYEAVDLPAQLAQAPRVDLRANFKQGLTRLTQILKTGTAIEDKLPHSNILNLPTYLPLSVLFVGLVFLCTSLIAIYATVIAAQIANPLSILIVFIIGSLAAWVGYSTWMFFQHRISYGTMRALLVLPPASAVIIAGYALPIEIAGWTRTPAVLVWMFLPSAILSIIGVLPAFWLLRTSPNILRWVGVGTAPQALRSRLGIRLVNLISDQLKIYAGRKSYHILYEPADENVAAAVQNSMSLAGHRRQYKLGEGEPDLYLAIVSNVTTKEQFKSWIANYGSKLVCIIAAPIQFPADVPELTQFQWLDFRTQSTQQLDIFASTLRDESGGWAVHALYTEPLNVRQLLTPWRVTLFTYMLRNWGAANLLLGVMILILPNGPVALDGIMLILGGILNFHLVERLLARKIFLTELLPLFVIGTFAALYIITMAFGQAYVGVMLRQTIQSAVVVVIWIAICYGSLRRWLPVGKFTNAPEKTFAPTLGRRIRLVNTLWLVGVAVLALFYFISVSSASNF